MKTQNREDDAYEKLKKQILGGELLPGDILSEATLSKHLGMSRTPVRCALKQLEYEGFILYHKNRGISIRETSSREMAEILEMMILFEHQAINRARRGEVIFDLERLETLAQSAADLRAQMAYAAYIEKTRQYNSCFIESAGNTQMTTVYNTAWDRVISTSIYNKMTHPTAIPKKAQTTIGFIIDLTEAIKDHRYNDADSLLDEYHLYARDQIIYYGQI